ncbi:hypothetical protein C8J57DRAFT_1718841 [Mycena rebaudengoi]|nr:hypothetical protein C8J57DRAFT_1718841 [Mycena rebaudengoi]
MAHHKPSGASRVACPQELIDLILGKSDKEDLKSCALVAHSFLPTSQKMIFSDLTILPSGCDSIPTLQRLAGVFSASPHLALYVRTLRLVQPGLYKPCVWMQSDLLPAILSVFTKLNSLKVRIYNWDRLHPNCEQAIYALIRRSSLSSIDIEEGRFQTNAKLLSLVRCFPASLESASFLEVFAGSSYWSDNHDAEFHQLRLASLHLDCSTASTLFHWASGAVDPKCLRHLQTTVDEDTMDIVQQLLDSAIYVETYHLSFDSAFSHNQRPNIEKIQGLRTLEISVMLDWEEIVEARGQGRHNPLKDAMRTLGTASPSVEHLILNLNIWNPDEMSHFMRFAALRRLAGDRPALRDVVVRIVSRYTDHSALQRGVRYLETVFSGLHKRRMLTVIVVRPRENN